MNFEIIPIWQPLSCSTHIIAYKISQKLGVKTSHTGTLDPMAEGVIIVLSGETRLKKYEFAFWEKEYEFEILPGVSTDSFDAMGIFYTSSSNDFEDFPKKTNFSFLNSFIGPYQQTYPIFSTKVVNKKHLHEHARANASVELPKKEGEIKELVFLGEKKIEKAEVLNSIISRISKIKGDFRQEEIISQWKNSKLPPKLPIYKFKVRMSKGLYVRSLAQDICKRVNSTGICYSIVRTKNGDFSKENSKTLLDLQIPLD